MLNQKPKVDVVEKFKVIRLIYDKIFICIAGSLWILSTLWDVYKLQRYWLDYSIEFYSCFFIFYMIIYSINPKSLPVQIYNSFRLLTTIKGRGTLLIIISSLFLNDKHAFHKYCAFLLFIGGILYFICEILVPTTKEELDKIESLYNNNAYIRDVNISNNSNMNNDFKISTISQSNSNNNINNNESKDKDTTKSQNNAIQSEKQNIKNINYNKEEEENNNKNNTKVEEEVAKKTSNPYEIPDDF